MRLYLKYVSIHLKSQMQYKMSFLLTMIGQFITAFSALLTAYFMMQRFGSINGYSLSEVLLCFAIVLMAFSLSECFARGFDMFPNMLGNGEFDRILVRPKGIILQVLGSKVEFTKLGRLIQAVLVFAYAIPASPVVWTPDKILTLVLMVLGGVAVFSGLFVIYATLCFFTTQGLEVMNIFTDGGKEFGKYPFEVYGKGILKFFTYVIPMAWFQQYPLMYLLGHSENKWLMVSPLICFLFLIPCYVLWRFGLRHYKSTGS